MEISKLNDREFQRFTGIKKNTYNKMLEVVTEAHRKARSKCGVQSKFSIEEMLLITIEYWRSDCSYFSLGKKYNIIEGYCYKIVRRIKDYLIKIRRIYSA